MIKAIFFDVDGTIYSHRYHRIPQSTIYALDLLKQKGILRVLATGRCLEELQQIQLEYMDFDAFITLNGQLILNKEKQLIIGNPIQEEDMERLLKHYNEKKIPIQFIEETTSYINIVDDNVRKAQGDINTPVPPIQAYTNHPVYQAIAFGSNEMADLLEADLPGCLITRWNNVAVDIISKTGGKANGIKQYIDLVGIKQEETMSFGDDVNDLDMLKFTKLSVAMGNGKEIVKEAATYTTNDIDEAGLFQALKHFNII